MGHPPQLWALVGDHFSPSERSFAILAKLALNLIFDSIWEVLAACMVTPAHLVVFWDHSDYYKHSQLDVRMESAYYMSVSEIVICALNIHVGL